MQALLRFTLDLFESLSQPGSSPAHPPAAPRKPRRPPRPRGRPGGPSAAAGPQAVPQTAPLWDALPLPEAAPGATETAAKTGPQKTLLRQENKEILAPDSIANSDPPAPAAPPQTLAQSLTPARFAHPQANRQAVLDGTEVAYLLRCGRRRTIGFVVGPQGLAVSAPRWVPLSEIDHALQEKAAWVVRKLGETQDRQQRLEAARIDWRDGATLPFLGRPIVLRLDPTQRAGAAAAQLLAQPLDAQPNTHLNNLLRHENIEDPAIENIANSSLANSDSANSPLAQSQPAPGGHTAGAPAAMTLLIGLPRHASAEQIRDATQAWLMRQARRIFTERLDHFAPQLGVRWQKLSLSSADTRWGTASACGAIRLNWRLIHLPMSMVDYVVAHELSHLRVMDHSPRFWETVGSVMPDYAQRRKTLRQQAVPPLE